MEPLKDFFSTCCDNIIEVISNIIAPFISLVEIACSIASWIIFLNYFISYSKKNITGYEYYNNYVFVFEGSGPRERVFDTDCEYIKNESIGHNLILYLKHFPKNILVIFGSIWLLADIIVIGILIIYFLLKLKKVEINQRKRVNINALKLIFDFAIPLVMIPI